MARLPRMAAEGLVRRKLAEVGIDDEPLVARLGAALLSAKEGPIEIEHEADFVLTIGEQDLELLSRSIESFRDNLPTLLRGLAQDAANRLSDSFQEQWRERRAAAEADLAAMRKKIGADWGETFDRLRLLVEACRQKGEEFNHALLRQKRRAPRDEALDRLQIRACRIADEIVLLLDDGHVEGARSRWRTLHEVGVTSVIIAQGGDALARRYFDHQVVEALRMLEDEDRAAAAAGRPPAVGRVTTEVRDAAAAAVDRHRRPFRGAYGWAAGQLGLSDKPQFFNLQELAGTLAVKGRYRLASQGTHASPQALGQPFHRWDPTLHVPGAFSAGFEGPAVDTAFSLLQATLPLFKERWDMDGLAHLQALVLLRDRVQDAATRAVRTIERRHAADVRRASRSAERRPNARKSRPRRA